MIDEPPRDADGLQGKQLRLQPQGSTHPWGELEGGQGLGSGWLADLMYNS